MSKEIMYWKMHNGKLISVDDMDINHLRNVLKMIIRSNQKIKKESATIRLTDCQELEQSLDDDLGIGNYDAGEFYL